MQESTVGAGSDTRPSEKVSDRVQAKKQGMSPTKLALALVVVVGVLATSWYFGNLLAGVFALLALGHAARAFLLNREHQRVLSAHQHLSLDHYELERDKKEAENAHRDECTRAATELKRARDETQAMRDLLAKVEPRAYAHAHEKVGQEMVKLTKDKLAALEAQAAAEKVAREAVESRDRFAQMMELHGKLSVLKDVDAWWADFRDEGRQNMSWSAATHVAVIAVKGRACRGIPIRIPNEEYPAPFITKNVNLGIVLQVVRSPITGKLSITLTDTRWAPETPALIETHDPCGQALIVEDDSAAMIIRATVIEAYRDIAVVQSLMRALQSYGPYFKKLQGTPGFRRQVTQAMPVHAAPALKKP